MDVTVAMSRLAPDQAQFPSDGKTMTDFIDIAGWAATAVALAGVWMNNRRRRACFVLWLVSNAITFGIHAAAGMWPLAARDGAFFILAIHGWWLWAAHHRKGELP